MAERNLLDAPTFDREVRAAIGRLIRERGALPTIDDVASLLRTNVAAVDASFVRMADAHVFIPRAGSHEMYAYNPFCAERTDFHVRADGRDWWGICGWDALGIAPALGTSGTLDAPCGDGCGERLVIDVADGGVISGPDRAVLHVGVPAREFWNDIFFT